MSPDEPDELKRVTVDVTFTVITCARCAARGRIDPLRISTTTTAPCTCGCDGFLMLCQVCGEPIGWGITGGTLDLGDGVGDATGEMYRDLFRETDITVINGETGM